MPRTGALRCQQTVSSATEALATEELDHWQLKDRITSLVPKHGQLKDRMIFSGAEAQVLKWQMVFSGAEALAT